MRLFPKLEGVWQNTNYGTDYLSDWRRERLACSPQHFPTYFKFTVGNEVVSKSVILELIAKAGDPNHVRNTLSQAASERLPSGITRACLFLDELNDHSLDVREEHVPVILGVLFELGDLLNAASGERQPFEYENNQLRLHWLLNRLVRERFVHERRSQIVLEASRSSALGWLVDLARRCLREHEPRDGVRPTALEDRLTTRSTADEVVSLALERIRSAAQRSELASHPELISILWRWAEFSPNGPEEAREWCRQRFDDNRFHLADRERSNKADLDSRNWLAWHGRSRRCQERASGA